MKPEDLERYARHIVLREIGGPGQQKLLKSKVLVIGAGGLGSPALMYLAAAGIGTLGIVDDDVVSLSNMQRQVLHATNDIGRPKTISAQQNLADINPNIRVKTYNARLNSENVNDILEAYDLILDGSDNFETRHLVNAACVYLKLPLISAAMSQWEGQISLFDPSAGYPCYACVFPNIPADGLAPSCAEAGVMGALAGVMGSMMASEAIKYVTGAGEGLGGKLLIYDALYSEVRKLSVQRRADCKICVGSQR